MQGFCNLDLAKTFLSSQKPVALILQECRITAENKNSFNHKLYNTHLVEPDLVTYLQKDVQATLITTIQNSEISLLAVRENNTDITLNNVYSRDSNLMLADLEALFMEKTGNWHNMPLPEKVQAFTTVQQKHS